MGSSNESGTLYQLRNLINWRNITNNPDSNVAGSEDLLVTVVEAHIVAAAMEIFETKSIEDTPSVKHFPIDCERFNSIQKKKILIMACSAVVDKFVQIIPHSTEVGKSTTTPSTGENTPQGICH